MSSVPPTSLPEPPIRSASPFSFRPPPPQSNRFLNPPDQNKAARRASRNFEDDLLNNSTIHLKSGTVDESKLGVFTPPFVRSFRDPDDGDSDVSPSMSRNRQPPNRTLQPPTPKVVPPTPDANSPTGRPVLFNDEEDRDADNKRRSLLRSPGTSSSPDLATLVRKARERGGVVGSRATEENKASIPQVTINESSPSSARATTGNPSYLSPAPSGSRLRVTSSTSSFSVVGPPETPIRNMSKTQSFTSRKIVKQQPSPLTSSVSNASQLSLLYQFGKDSGKVCHRGSRSSFVYPDSLS
jgi:PH and SEC7 domain-containing protein